MARVLVKGKKGKDGEWTVSYEVEGMPGTSCEQVADIMAGMGNVIEKKATNELYQHEVPVPVPNQVRTN